VWRGLQYGRGSDGGRAADPDQRRSR
jgi:hypothetical protein